MMCFLQCVIGQLRGRNPMSPSTRGMENCRAISRFAFFSPSMCIWHVIHACIYACDVPHVMLCFMAGNLSDRKSPRDDNAFACHDSWGEPHKMVVCVLCVDLEGQRLARCCVCISWCTYVCLTALCCLVMYAMHVACIDMCLLTCTHAHAQSEPNPYAHIAISHCSCDVLYMWHTYTYVS